MITQKAVDVPALLDQQKLGWFQLRLLGLCALVVMLDGFDIQSIGYVAPAVARDLHLSYAQLSPVFASGLLGLTIGALICGPLADWFGRRIMIITGTLFFAVFTLATAMAASLPSLILFRFVSGLGLGGVMPNAIALTSEFCPRRRHGTMVMVMNSGFPLGSALGGFAAAPIIPAYGWRSVFILGGILPLVLVPLLIFLLPESIRYLVLTGNKPSRIAALLARMNPRLSFSSETSFVIHEQRAPGIPVAHLFREGRALPTLLMWIVFFVSLLDLFLLTNWLPTVFHDSGITLTLSVIATALFSGGGVIGAWALGCIIDRFGPYRVLSVNYFLGAVFVALLGPSHSIGAIMICTFFAGVGIIGGQIGANLLAASFYPTFIRSTGVGWALGIGRVGSIVGPVFGGILLSRHRPLTTIFLASAIPVVFGSAAVFAMGRTQIVADAERRKETDPHVSEQPG
jgi:AAHS family 4-hydroxybenzoate transporter-like MFS transporter